MDYGFTHLCRLVADHSGLLLTEDKRYLVETRLAPIAERLHLENVNALLERLKLEHASPLVLECVDALATHESSFFRDTMPFVQLADQIIPRLIQEKATSKSIRIWSAACSTGQEPYSIAMVLAEYEHMLRGWHIEILATDLVSKAIEQARSGFYTDFEVGRGLKPDQIQRWFRKTDGGYLINPTLRANINFRKHNLLDPVIEHGPFDVIMCRNVLIYFDRQRKIDALQRLASVLAPDGTLILGSSETVIGISEIFEPIAGQRGLFHTVKHAASGSSWQAPSIPAPIRRP